MSVCAYIYIYIYIYTYMYRYIYIYMMWRSWVTDRRGECKMKTYIIDKGNIVHNTNVI